MNCFTTCDKTDVGAIVWTLEMWKRGKLRLKINREKKIVHVTEIEKDVERKQGLNARCICNGPSKTEATNCLRFYCSEPPPFIPVYKVTSWWWCPCDTGRHLLFLLKVTTTLWRLILVTIGTKRLIIVCGHKTSFPKIFKIYSLKVVLVYLSNEI